MIVAKQIKCVRQVKALQRGAFLMEKIMRLMQGDCLELMKDIPSGSVDAILCDPPYGIDYSSSRIKDKALRLGGIKNDKHPFIWWIHDAFRIIKSGGQYFAFLDGMYSMNL